MTGCDQDKDEGEDEGDVEGEGEDEDGERQETQQHCTRRTPTACARCLLDYDRIRRR